MLASASFSFLSEIPCQIQCCLCSTSSLAHWLLILTHGVCNLGQCFKLTTSLAAVSLWLPCLIRVLSVSGPEWQPQLMDGLLVFLPL